MLSNKKQFLKEIDELICDSSIPLRTKSKLKKIRKRVEKSDTKRNSELLVKEFWELLCQPTKFFGLVQVLRHVWGWIKHLFK